MESSNNENHATKFVNDLEIIEEKAAAEGDEVGEGGEIEEVEGEEQEKAGGGEGEGEEKAAAGGDEVGGGGEIEEVEGEEQEKAGGGEGEKAGGEEGKKAGGEEEQEKAEEEENKVTCHYHLLPYNFPLHCCCACKKAGGEEQEKAEEEEEEEEEEENKDEDYRRYIPLLNAALRGDWDSAEEFFRQYPDALTAHITDAKVTALHAAIVSGRSIEFVEKLVDLIERTKMRWTTREALELCDIDGATALFHAARTGNKKAAVILVEKCPTSLYIRNEKKWLPLHTAANEGHKDTLSYLLSVTEDDPVYKPFAHPSGALLLLHAVDSGFYDIALDLVRRFPKFATSTLDDGGCALKVMARSASAFRSGIHLNRWQRLIYYYVPVKLENYADQDHNRSDIENPVNSSQVITQKHSWARILGANYCNSVSQKLQVMLWKVLELLVPHIKHVQKQKLTHLQAIQLVKSMCEKIRSLTDPKDYELLCKDVLLQAANFGIHEIVEEVIESNPHVACYKDEHEHNIFQLAVIYRNENVFNLIYQMSGYKQYMMIQLDNRDDNILHLAGQLAPFDKLNLVAGAALQMQRELQWFKEVEKFMSPRYKEFLNCEDESPSMIFTAKHKTLVVEGEKWMKDTANSCTITAALIATIAFAAVITVPGGTNGTNGIPIFSKANAFIVFIISDAISLFTSTTSLLMFLSIHTSRYAEGDFLYVLPKRLIIGLVTLFMSITTMILAFSATLYLVFGNNKEWILIPVSALACVPITSFVSLQFPLLVDLISSTYGPGIFGKQSDRLFH